LFGEAQVRSNILRAPSELTSKSSLEFAISKFVSKTLVKITPQIPFELHSTPAACSCARIFSRCMDYVTWQPPLLQEHAHKPPYKALYMCVCVRSYIHVLLLRAFDHKQIRGPIRIRACTGTYSMHSTIQMLYTCMNIHVYARTSAPIASTVAQLPPGPLHARPTTQAQAAAKPSGSLSLASCVRCTQKPPPPLAWPCPSLMGPARQPPRN
jgi:hypothetical protein